MAGVSRERHVGVPPAGPVHLAVDGQHLGALLDGGEHGVGLGHHTELAGEIGLLLGRERLVAEEDHVVRVQRLAHGGHDGRRQWLRQVDVPDLSSDGGGEGMHAEAGGNGHPGIVPDGGVVLNPARPDALYIEQMSRSTTADPHQSGDCQGDRRREPHGQS